MTPVMTQVCVLAGGLSHERDVSIRSGRRVADALRSAGMSVVVRDVDADLLPALANTTPDCVIPLLHGAPGEDGSLRDVLASLHIPFVGTKASASRIAFDKMIAKTLLAQHGVRSPAAVALPHSTFRDLGAKQVLGAVVEQLGLPIVVKPTRGGSSLGVTVVRDISALPAAMVGCFAYTDTAMLEAFVAGTEVAVSIIEDPTGAPVALPAVEICPDSGIYDFASRYTAGTTEFFVPARLDPELADECARIALLAHTQLQLRHLSRADLIVDKDGNVEFLEVNVAPGCTETSLLPQSVLASGRDLGQVMADLVTLAVGAP